MVWCRLSGALVTGVALIASACGDGDDSNASSGDAGSSGAGGSDRTTGGAGGGSSGAGTGGATNTGGTSGSGGVSTGGGTASGGGPGASGADAGLDAATSSDAATDAPVAESGTTCNGTCVEPAPADWLGPFALHSYVTQDAAPQCGGGFPTLVDDFFADFRPNAASCDCECTVGASACAVEVWAETTCTPSGSRSFAITPLSCTPVTDTGRFIATPPSEQVICNEPVVTEVLPTPTFATGLRACEGPLDAAGCDASQLCAPDDRDRTVCIVRAGNRQCPDGPYSERRIAHTGFNDTRSCSACTCSGTATCAGTIEFRSGTGGCPANQIGTLAVNDQQNCTTASLTPTHAFFDATTFGGRCDATGGVLTGAAQATGPQTLCCLPVSD